MNMDTPQSEEIFTSNDANSLGSLGNSSENGTQYMPLNKTILDGADTSEEIMLNSEENSLEGGLETNDETTIGTSRSNNGGVG